MPFICIISLFNIFLLIVPISQLSIILAFICLTNKTHQPSFRPRMTYRYLYHQSLPMAAAHKIKIQVHRHSVEPKATCLGFKCHIWLQKKRPTFVDRTWFWWIKVGNPFFWAIITPYILGSTTFFRHAGAAGQGEVGDDGMDWLRWIAVHPLFSGYLHANMFGDKQISHKFSKLVCCG